MLDVTRLRVLAAVARHGSVTEAANQLGYAQPSVSHHLARLEAETGARLFQRVGRGIRLTAAGQLLAERAEEILGRIAATETELAEYTGLRAGQVRIAAFPSALGTFVPKAAAAFASAHPLVEVQILEAEPPEALRLLRSGNVDVAVTFEYPETPAGENRGIRRARLFVEPLYLVTPFPQGTEGGRSASIVTRERISSRLLDHATDRWIGGCERCRDNLRRQCSTAGFTPRIEFKTDDYVAVQSLVAAGLGVATLPELALAAHRHPAVEAIRLPDGARTISAAVYGEPPDAPAPSAMLRQLAIAARQLRARVDENSAEVVRRAGSPIAKRGYKNDIS